MTPSDGDFDLLDLAGAPPSTATGAAELTVTCEAAGALAERLGTAPDAIWRAAWVLVLARLGGVTRVRVGRARFDVPARGELAAWLARAPETADTTAQSTWSDDPSDAGALLRWQARGTSAIARFEPAQLDRATVARLGELLGAVLAAMAAPGAQLEAISPLSPAERGRVIDAWNQTTMGYRPEATVHGLVREQAAAHPERTALAWDGGSLSYRDLDRWSDALAERLIAAGVSADQPVALVLPRSPEAVVAALAIVKAGGAYLPLDPDYPAERLAFAIGDSGAQVLVTSRALGAALAHLAPRTIFAEESPRDGGAAQPRVERATPRTRAYIMYTSGSTGTPKGVQIEHRSIVRLVGQPAYVRLAPDTRFLHAAPLGFDASTLEIWGPLVHGGTCVIYRDPVPTGRGLAKAIAAHGVTTMWLTSALFNSVVDEDPRLLTGVRQLFTGGDVLSPSHVRRALAALPETELNNGYGPTECTTFATTYRIPRELPDGPLPIGAPIADTQCYVLARDGAPVPIGIAGELFVGGLGVARGYLARPALDAEKLVANPFGEGKLYRTGDRARWRPDGALDFLGRVDQQVKLRGFRIELGEIEARLGALPGVASCAVTLRDDGPIGKRLVAYVVASDPHRAAAPALRAQLAKLLPDFMVPAAFVAMDALPVTANGKLDRNRLPAPTSARPELAAPYRAPATERETAICAAFADVLGLDRVGANDGFFELGGNSLLSLRLLARMREQGLPDISPAIFFAAPTPAALAKAIASPTNVGRAAAPKAVRSTNTAPIAIVGFAGRFPGAPDVAAFWKNLCDGVESIRAFAPHELDPSIPAAQRTDPAYVAARGVLDGVELFDAGFFGITPLEAQLLDPQHRHFLEIAWHALEHAGYVPETAPGPVGIFGGMYNASYFQKHLVPRPDVASRLGELALMLGNEKDYVTTRVAHKLGLTGPAVAIHTACSTSLVATAMAMDSLRNGGCDLALAGGVAITCPPNSGYFFQDGSMASPDGKTRTFDAKAGGTVFSDGVAMVVLRRLSDALAAGDAIYAVLLGAAVNNDGSERASFTAPSPDGQARVIAAAHDAAGIDARTLSYVEAHGTATPLGDPIEIEGLARAFARHTSDRGFCAIGSLKSNVGHLVIAAGAASLIKTSLALHHKLIPPSINFTAPSPKIDFDKTPFRVQTALTPWPNGQGRRRAGVSSFGFGGTNAHAVLEEAPPVEPSSPSPRAAEVLLVSARTPQALAQASANLATVLQTTDGSLADIAHTLQTGRRGFAHRRYVVASTAADAARALAAPEPATTREVGAELPDLGLLCPGQGAQYARMGHGLYHSEPAFRAAYDECCAILEGILGSDPREFLFSEDPGALTPTSHTQPAIFALEYSLARTWMSWGVNPTALIGHSVGEWVCAALADVMALPDALALVVERGRRMQALPAGSMLSVRLPAAELQPKLPHGVEIAAENAPGLCVASGPTPLIDRLEAELASAGVAAKKLVTSHAFHSAMMEPVIAPLAEQIAKVKLAPPKLRIMSTVTARWLTDAEATSVEYWAEHLRRPVRFAPAARALLGQESGGARRVLIEIGPRATLTALARQAAPGKRALPPALPSLGDSPEREPAALAAALGQVWSLGAAIDWSGYRQGERRRRVPLPLYPFQRQRYWVDAPAIAAAPAAIAVAPVLVPEVAVAVPELVMPNPVSAVPVDRRPRLVASIAALVEDVSGLDVTAADPATPWLDLGLDSLTLTQLALAVQRAHGVKVTFRQVMESFPTIAALAQLLDEQLPPEEAPAAAPAPVVSVAPAIAAPVLAAPALAAPGSDYVRQVIDTQLALMKQQLALLGGAPAPAVPAPAPVAIAPAPPVAPKVIAKPATKNEDEPAAVPQTYDVKKAFGAIARIHTVADELTPRQRQKLDALVARYTRRTAKSKAYTVEHRPHMADPRVVNGFRPLTKELTYQIVVERSRGSKLWDIDGNEYVDILQGFGMSMFGWQPDFVREAVHAQVDLGYEIGPQHVLAGKTAKLFCEVTGAERAAFCNTGSEAVMGTMRIARTVTGRRTIAVFTGAYHGIFDEVIVRGTRKLKSIPAAPGIMPSMFDNIMVLDYGTPEAMEILKSRADELAAIVVEPVQSRRPDFQPVEFLRELRRFTEAAGIVLVFDEVVCGFRAHPQGAQGLFGIRADLASYGKVVGGGFSIGVIAGKRQFMDALDGGDWQYGDDSIPSVGVTYFAGTFVRHPLALAATHAVLRHLQEQGPELQQRLTATTAAMVAEINAHMSELGAPFKLNTFASLWRNAFTEDLPYGDLIYAMLRDRGIHVLDNFPCFLTTAHSAEDVAAIVAAYKAAASEMQASEFFPKRHAIVAAAADTVAREAPAPGDRSVAREAPTTEPQREIWLADKLSAEASLAYNESIALHLRGELDLGALRRAVRELIARHDALRATFSADGTAIRTGEPPELELPLRDLSSAAEPEVELAAIAHRHVTEAFDLERGPLVRAEIAQLSPNHHVLVFTGHHIAIDGWSFWVVVKELAALYGIATGTRREPLPPAPSYIDYAHGQRADSPERTANETWWVGRFADGVPALELPADRPRPPVRTTTAGREDRVLPAELVASVKALGKTLGASFFATLLAGFDALLHRISGATDLIVGVPAAGQLSAGLEGLVGHCVNMLPLRTRIDRAQSFRAHVVAAKHTMLDAYDRENVTFGRVLQMLPIARDPSRLPLVSVVFNIDQALASEHDAMPGIELELRSNPRTHETFELFINAVDSPAGMRLEAQYNADLFDAKTIQRWLAAFEVLLAGAVTDPDRPIGRLPIVPDADRRQLAIWNGTEREYPRTRRIEELILETARRVPDRVAVTCKGARVSYKELADRACAIAAELRARGVRRGDRVGLFVERSADMVASIVGTLAAGAAYVPLDPSFPAERLRFMISDAELAAIVASPGLARADVGRVPVVALDAVPRRAELPDSVRGTAEETAYVIYTSGSTGKPKGVCVPHRAAINLMTSVTHAPGLTEREVVLAVTTLSFDIALSELVLPLVIGAQIVLADRGEATDGDALRALIEAHGVTFIDATPSTWRLLLAAGWQGGAGVTAICTGEAMPRELARELLPRTGALWNGYGPTETTVWSTFYKLAGDGPIAIGTPVANTKIHVLDADLQPVPVGVVGELVISGDGVTQGYLDRPELTAERFVRDPASAEASARMYRTGDLGRWRGDGVLECLGRTDFQVKVRGYRIELGEIEAQLVRHSAIAAVAVIAREDRPGDVRIVGYVVGRGGVPAPGDDALRAHLAETLPEYMIPSRFVQLAALPLLPNGKVDRKALPAPSGPALAHQDDVAPRSPTEELVAIAYMEALAIPRLSIHDDFFALGGHSLLVAQMTAKLAQRLGRAVPMRAGFEHPTVAKLATWLDGARARSAAPPTIPQRAGAQTAPLSLMQQRVWYLEQLQLGKTVFHVPSAHRLRGPLDLAKLGRAFDRLVERQSVLRTQVGTVGDEAAQIVVDRVDTAIPFDDLSSSADPEAELARRMAAATSVPFDLTRAPLWRVHLYKLGPDHHVLYFMPHHIIFDGWSFDLLYDEMAAQYAGKAMPPLAVTYGDFAAWHREWLAGPELRRQVDHWSQKLTGAPDALDLPLDKPRPPIQSGEGATEWLALPDATVRALRAVGLREGATLFMTLLGAWLALLHQLTRQRDIIVGTPVRGRELPEIEPVMGFFVNALPLRLRVDPDATFLELLRHVRGEAVEAFGVSDVPFEHLVRELGVSRDESRFPIYQAFFSYQDARQRPSAWGDLQHQNVPIFQPASAQDVALWFLDGRDGVVGGLNYNTDIIEAETAARWRKRFLALAEAIAERPDRPLRELLAIVPEERAQLVHWNETARPLASDANLVALFADLAARGDAPAVRHQGATVTYAQLAAERDRVAAALAARGVGAGDVVALLVDRTPFLLSALLGTLAAGATYLPLDPNFPPSRLRFMLDDSGAKVVITDVADPDLDIAPDLLLRHAQLAGAALAAQPRPAPAPDSAAYLIYTSGSTGRPKGVRVPHRAVVSFLQSMRERPGLAASDRLVAVTTLSFDIAVLELLLPLVVGAEIVLATREQATDGTALRALVESCDATLMQATPATWRMLIEAGWRGGTSFTALCGGEALPAELATRLRHRTGALWNMYGPTETTVWSTCAWIGESGVTIGTPIANTQVWIVDEHGELAPIGVPGELCIGGAGVALGYHARPELTAERFIPDPFSDGAAAGTLYRTGDLARWRGDGQLVHLGRTDFQVKVRGYRIELGEIELALARHPQVAQAVVAAQPGPGGEQRLVAYVVGRTGAPATQALREHLRASLPDYMVPATYVTLAALPLTPNGKVDRKALPPPTEPPAGERADERVRGPRTHSEELVATVWRELLGVERISVTDQFLDLGGHSLLIMQAIAKLEARTGKRISPRAFIFQTLEQIAREYEARPPEPPRPAPPPAGRLQRWLSSLIPGSKS